MKYVCNKCKELKSLEDFRITDKINSKGVSYKYRHPICKKCNYQRCTERRQELGAIPKNVSRRSKTFGNELLYKCGTCNQYLPRDSFHKNKRSKIDGISWTCKSCRSISRRASFIEKTKNSEDIIKYLYKQLKNRANRNNIEFNIDPEDIHIPTKCKYLDIELNWEDGKDHLPSIDRIDNSKGYIKGNIQVISYKANRAKANLNKNELILFANRLLQFHS